MPKETIHDEAGLYDVAVGWNRDTSHVQLGTVIHQDPDKAEVTLPALLKTWQDEGDHHTGLWATLDRDGINRLIRSLRRARDQAYGKDE